MLFLSLLKYELKTAFPSGKKEKTDHNNGQNRHAGTEFGHAWPSNLAGDKEKIMKAYFENKGQLKSLVMKSIFSKRNCTWFILLFLFLEVFTVSRRDPILSCSFLLSFTGTGPSTRTGLFTEDCNESWTHAHSKTPRNAM